MHYGPKSFTRNGRATIVGLKTGADKMGQRKELSANDIRQINKLYKCPKSKLDLESEVRGAISKCNSSEPLPSFICVSIRFQHLGLELALVCSV